MIVIDQMQRKIELPAKINKIISLVPSQTEFLFDLGLEDKIVGITKFCVQPREKIKSKIKIGGTKNFNFEKIDALNPDFIIGNKEENYQVGIEKLTEKYPVWMSDIFRLEDAYEMMRAIGQILSKSEEADDMLKKIQLNFERLQQFISLNIQKKPQVAYFIWMKPWIVVGRNTFIHHLMEVCGFENVFASENRYPEITENQLREVNPDLILLSSEPYPFKDEHIEKFRMICPQSKIFLVDGEMFSWYGSRLIQAPIYFQKLIQTIDF